MSMADYVIRNRVPSPEEMGRTLGVSRKRVAEVRIIMSSPSAAASKRSRAKSRVTTKKSGAKRSNSRKSGRR